MELRRAFGKFASHELHRWDYQTSTFVATGIMGSLQVYDRFVSDRDFGQKKRIFLCPGGFDIDRHQLIVKIPDVPGVWMVEGSNPDADSTGVYGTPVVLREAKHRVKLLRKEGTKTRRSGVGYTDETKNVILETWADFSRYSSTESRELSGTDYTIGSWYLPQGCPVDLDTIIEDNYQQRFMTREVSSFLDLLMVRAQEREDLV